ncbi:MAG: aa3-type cytochrome c oxidase subunit IV [Caulobacter sp.]|nr:aa3-type cytochrome c oxidase subunit IV [Caulobacter sp.]
MASDYHRGDMDITEQAATFHAVMGLTKWGSLAVAVAILVPTLWFCTDAGFFGGAISGAVLTVAGILLLREKKAGGH